MRRHGWDGNPPADEAEARQRIIAAAMACVDTQGAMQASLSDVATKLGVTRQTVYRYYPSTDDLFVALAEVTADDFIGRIVDRMCTIDDPVDAMVEGLAYTIEALPTEQYLGLLLRTGGAQAFTMGIVSEVAMDFGRSLLDRTAIDWAALGYGAGELDGLVEFMLRLIQTFSLTPVGPTGDVRSPEELRAFLQRWLAPTIRPQVGVTAASAPVPSALN